MTKNRSMPPGTFIPELAYPDVPQAAAWLCEAFGFTERLRIGAHRVQLTFGRGSMVATEGSAARPQGASVMVHVEDVDALVERARRTGAAVIREPADHPYGERQATVVDPGGHVWTFSQSVADVHPRDWGGTLLEE
jgi:uncharacterized glyoxalase superfamily protein PhnB